MQREDKDFISQARARLDQLEAELHAARREMADTPKNDWELLDRVASGHYEHARRLLESTPDSGDAMGEDQMRISEALKDFGTAVEALGNKRTDQ